MSKRTDQFKKELDAVTPTLVNRAKGVCEAGTPDCGKGLHLMHRHHRKIRSQGGTNKLDNLIYCCDGCHTYIHAHPEESYSRGWLLRSGNGRIAGNGMAYPS
jgi:hypothetical protein